MSGLPPRPPSRRIASVPRQALEGVGIVTAMALLVAGTGYLVAVVVSWIF